MKTLLLSLLSLIVIFSCCEENDSTESIIVDYKISVDEQFSIELTSNPSTGYSWQWVNSDVISIVDSIDHSFIKDNPNVIGGGGKEIWEFIGIKAGLDTLIFERSQAWNPGSAIDTIDKVVRVK